MALQILNLLTRCGTFNPVILRLILSQPAMYLHDYILDKCNTKTFSSVTYINQIFSSCTAHLQLLVCSYIRRQVGKCRLLLEIQCGFPVGRSTTEQMFNILSFTFGEVYSVETHLFVIFKTAYNSCY